MNASIATINDAQIDALLQTVVERLHAAFGTRVSGFYLVGSYAMRCAVATSDVDVVALFRDAASASEHERFRAIVASLRSESTIKVDITIVDYTDLVRDGATRFTFASVLLAGEDVRSSLPLRSPEAYVRSEMASALAILRRTRSNPPTLSYPLAAPDPADEFLGYAARRLQTPAGDEQASTKDLVLSTVMIATALVAEAGQYVHHKSQVAAAYRATIGGEWVAHIDQVYSVCRNQSAYGVPADSAGRRLLRELCERQLAFENAFVPRCITFWQREAANDDEAVREQAQRQLAVFARESRM